MGGYVFFFVYNHENELIYIFLEISVMWNAHTLVVYRMETWVTETRR